MSLAAPSAGEVFTLRVYKTLSANPGIAWANNYELQALEGATNIDLLVASATVVAYEAAFHASTVKFTRYVLSSWAADGEPYNPDTFQVTPLTTVGARSLAGTEMQPLQICAKVAFRPAFGRTGYRLYRGALGETEVSAGAGTPALVAGTYFGDTGAGTFTDAAAILGPYLAGGEENVKIVLKSQQGVRQVGQVVVSGVTVKKFNNRFYDRV